jgi:hypothetical protein
MTGRIKKFAEFTSERIVESDGFGTLPFLEKKNGNIYSYFFKIDSDSGKQRGFFLSLGKYSEFQDTPGPKNSYSVIRINEISERIIEDLAIDKAEIPLLNKEKFSVEGNEGSRLLEVIAKALLDYLQKNPQVIRFFDEIKVNAEFPGRDYLQDMKTTASEFLGPEWSVQEGTNSETLIISR